MIYGRNNNNKHLVVVINKFDIPRVRPQSVIYTGMAGFGHRRNRPKQTPRNIHSSGFRLRYLVGPLAMLCRQSVSRHSTRRFLQRRDR